MRLLWGFQSTQDISFSCLIYLPDSRQVRGHSEWRHLGDANQKTNRQYTWVKIRIGKANRDRPAKKSDKDKDTEN